MSQNNRVLCVDDEPNVLRSYNRALRNEEYGVLFASSGKEALEVLRANSDIRVLITDFRMAGMTGVELVHEVLKHDSKIICAILSGYADESTIQKALDTGQIDRFLLKPIDNEELKRQIRELLSKVRD